MAKFKFTEHKDEAKRQNYMQVFQKSRDEKFLKKQKVFNYLLVFSAILNLTQFFFIFKK